MRRRRRHDTEAGRSFLVLVDPAEGALSSFVSIVESSRLFASCCANSPGTSANRQHMSVRPDAFRKIFIPGVGEGVDEVAHQPGRAFPFSERAGSLSRSASFEPIKCLGKRVKICLSKARPRLYHGQKTCIRY